MKKIAGKAEVAEALATAFEAYQEPALGATRALIDKGEPGDQVKRMQAAIAALQQQIEQRKAEAAASVAAAQDGGERAHPASLRTAVTTMVRELYYTGSAIRQASKSIHTASGEMKPSRSAPAEKLLSRPVSTMARTRVSAFTDF